MTSSDFAFSSVFQRTRDGRTWRLLAAAAVLGGVLGLLYAWVLALPLYSSEATVVVRGGTENQSAPSASNLLRRGGATDALTLLDGMLVQEYLRSADAMRALDERVGFFSAFPTGSLDPAHYLPPRPSNEDRLAFYRSVIDVRYSMTRQVVEVSASARTAEEAERLAAGVVAIAEDFINRYNARVREDFVSVAEQDLDDAQQRMMAAQTTLASLRNATGRLDPAAEAAMIGSVIQQLEVQRVGIAAEAQSIRSLGAPDSPRLQRLNAELAHLDSAIEAQRARLVGSSGAVSTSLGSFEAATASLEFAEESVEQAREELAAARANFARQQKYLLTVASPSEPTERSWPRPFMALLAGALIGLVLGAISLLISRAFPVR